MNCIASTLHLGVASPFRIIHISDTHLTFADGRDGYYRFEDEQTEFLKKEAARGLPIVLMIHKPIYDEEMYEFSQMFLTFGEDARVITVR